MRFLNTWRRRFIVVAILGSFAFIAWVRFESRIAENPNGKLVMLNEETSQRATTRHPLPTNAASFQTGAMPVDVEQDTEFNIQNSPPEADAPLAQTFTIPVPFVSQAPFRVWDLPYKEFCEEASVYSLYLWKEGKPTPPADELDRELKDIQAWEMANLRTWEDTTADETARILKEKFGYVNTKVVRDATLAQMKTELRAGRPIVVPAAGRKLASPYYRPPGPLYHMLVIIGFDDEREEFITNDVGTNTKGAGFRFSYTNLYEAMGDWDIATGGPDTLQKVMIVVE